MNNLDYYIYYTICDYSLKYYKNYTGFSSYQQFCLHYKGLIENGSLIIDKTPIIKLIDRRLNKIFGLNPSDSIGYIFNYFSHSEWSAYEEVVMRTNELYGKCLN